MAVTKKEPDGDHPRSHYLVADSDNVSEWHLRVKDTSGNYDRGLCGAAWAALHSGYRGQKYSGPNKQEALAKLIAIYKSQGWDLPDTSENSSGSARAGSLIRLSDVRFDEDGPTVPDTVERTGLIFRCGDYPDKGMSLDEGEADAAIAAFEPCHLAIEHVPSLFDAKLGQLREVWREGSALMGRVVLPAWLADVLHDTELKVSTTWDRATKELRGLSLVRDPRVSDAVLMAKYAQFAGKRHSASDIADLQQIHDLASKQGASCPAGGERRTADGTDDEEGGDEDGGQTTSRMSRARRAPAHKDSPARKRSTGSMNLKEWILGKAQEDGVDLDSGDLAAAFAQQDDEARTKLAVLEEQNKALAAQVEAERTRVEQHEAAFARAAQDRREAEAATFAAQAVGAHRIAPAAQDALCALHARCATLDSTATFSAPQANEQAPKSTCALLADLVAQLPDLSVFTTEHIKPDQVAALFTQDTTPGVTGGGPKDMTAERRAELLAKTQLGRSIAQQHSSNGKS